jgi:hypothetical protein
MSAWERLAIRAGIRSRRKWLRIERHPCTVTRMDEFQEERCGGASPPQGNFDWRKSSQSFQEANCVEVACAGEHVFVRDSKAVADNGPHLEFSVSAWELFIKSIKDGETDFSGS